MAAEIDVEVRELVDNAYESAKSILTDHMDQLHLVAKYVYHHEKIDGEEFRKIMTGQMEWSRRIWLPCRIQWRNTLSRIGKSRIRNNRKLLLIYSKES